MPPFLGGAVGTGIEPPVHHGENSARSRSNRNARSPTSRRLPAGSRSLPQPFDSERRAELAGCHFGSLAALVGDQHHGIGGAGAQQPVEGAVLRQFVDPAEGIDHPLTRLAALVLDDLQILVRPERLRRKNMAASVNHNFLPLLESPTFR